MATRLYLTRNAPLVTAPAADAGWEGTAGALNARATLEKSTDALANTAVSTAAAANNDVLVGRFLSPPLDSNQTITGNVKGQVKVVESLATLDARSQVVIRVITPANAVRGTLLAMSAGALASEWPITTYTNRKVPVGGSTALGSVAALAGDRISIEVGARHHAAVASSLGMQFGSAVASDLPEDETSTLANAPWIEFDQTITFVPVVARVTKIATTALILPSEPNAFVSRVALTSLILNEAPRRRVQGVMVG